MKYPSVLLLSVMLQVPAMRAVFKYSPVPEIVWPLLMGCSLLLTGAFVLRWEYLEKRVFRHRRALWFLVLALGAFAAGTLVSYPIADGLKAVGRGSDADDAIIAGVRALLAGDSPYGQTTYLGSLLSPGPGWMLLFVPFVFMGMYHLANPLALTALAVVIAAKDSTAEAARFLCLLLSSLIVWELSAVGHDILTFSLVVPLFVLGFQHQRLTRTRFVALAILFGFVCTARIVYLYVPVLFAFALFHDNARRAVVLGLIALCTALTLHALFSFITEGFYHPFHLVQKADAWSPAWYKIFGALAACATGLIMVVRWKKWPPIAHIVVGLAVPLVWISLTDLLFNRHGDVSLWEGANYLVPFLPLTLYGALARMTQSSSASLNE